MQYAFVQYSSCDALYLCVCEHQKWPYKHFPWIVRTMHVHNAFRWSYLLLCIVFSLDLHIHITECHCKMLKVCLSVEDGRCVHGGWCLKHGFLIIVAVFVSLVTDSIAFRACICCHYHNWVHGISCCCGIGSNFFPSAPRIWSYALFIHRFISPSFSYQMNKRPYSKRNTFGWREKKGTWTVNSMKNWMRLVSVHW